MSSIRRVQHDDTKATHHDAGGGDLADLPDAGRLLAPLVDELVVLGGLLFAQAGAEPRVQVVQWQLSLQLSSSELCCELLLVLGQHGDVLLGPLQHIPGLSSGVVPDWVEVVIYKRSIN